MENGTVTQSAPSYSPEQIDFICAVEQLWWETGSLPTSEAISGLIGVSVASVTGYWALPHVRTSLLKRGVELEPKINGVLSIQQLDAVNTLLNPHDKRSLREKLSEVGVAPQKYQLWLRDAGFQAYITKRVEAMWGGTEAEAYLTLMNAVRGGSLEATKLFFEMRGIYNPRLQIDVNVDSVLSKVVEIITRHVRDPETLSAIAADLDLISTGGIGPATPQIPTHSDAIEAFVI